MSSGTQPTSTVQPICGTSHGTLISTVNATISAKNMRTSFFTFTKIQSFFRFPLTTLKSKHKELYVCFLQWENP